MIRTEHQHQALVLEWAELMESRWPELELLHAIPNGGDRNVRVAKKLKAEGVKPGVPDLHLPVPRGTFASLYVEMKTRRPRQTKTKGVRLDPTRTTADQELWITALRAVGHAVEVCYSAEEAQAVIERYLAGEYEPTERTK